MAKYKIVKEVEMESGEWGFEEWEIEADNFRDAMHKLLKEEGYFIKEIE